MIARTDEVRARTPKPVDGSTPSNSTTIPFRIFAAEEGGGSRPPVPPLSPAMTLGQFFDRYYLPHCMMPRGAAPNNVKEYSRSVQYWIELTGDPRLDQIDEHATTAFLTELEALIFERDGKCSPNTLVKHCRHLQTVLDRCGPSGPRNRQAKHLLNQVPYLPRPRARRKIPLDNYSIEEIRSMLDNAGAARRPSIDGVTPTAFWRSLIRFEYNVGLRIDTALRIRYPMVQEIRGAWWLLVPGEIYKGGDPRCFYLNAHALEALNEIRTDRALIFPWPSWPTNNGRLFAELKRILVAAEISHERHFAFHGFRKAMLTQLALFSTAAARIAGGHTTDRTTLEHYINPQEVAKASDKLPQP